MMCLNALWEIQEGNVEDVRKVVSQARPLAYTTVLTLLDRLSRRGAVSRRKEGRGFRYQPSIERNRLRRMALGQFLEHHFDGSVESLRTFLEAEPPAETEAIAAAAVAGAGAATASPSSGSSATVDAGSSRTGF